MEHCYWGESWKEGREMELVECRKQSKPEGEEVDLAGHTDQFSYTSAQRNPQEDPELPLCLVNSNVLQCH